MGGIFATFFKDRGIKVLISDKKTKLTNLELVEKSDIVIVSVPIHLTKAVLEDIVPHMRKDQALMDFTSVKVPALKLMSKAKSEVLGLHPMFADSNPIHGQTVIACKTRKSRELSVWMINFLEQHGVQIIEMSAKEHDKAMNKAQGVIHFADIAFIDVLRRLKMPIKELIELSSSSSELKIQLAARLIAQNPELYASIQIENPNTIKSLKQYQKAINQLMKIVKKKDDKAFIKYFERNKKYLGSYQKQSLKDSSYLIDKLLEKKRQSKKAKAKSPNKKHIAVLGPVNTYTDIAANKYSKAGKFYTKTVTEAFDLVEKSKVSAAIIPLENKLNGTVRETVDCLFHKKVHIAEEIELPIRHCLLALPQAKATNIKLIISHPQALQQCQKYLKKAFPQAETTAFASTAAAVEKLLISQNKEIAVIASEQAAKGLKIHKEDIADEKDNSTRFIVIKKGEFRGKKMSMARPGEKSPIRTSPAKTSIAFYFSQDSSGSLFTIFEIFAKAKINLTKIESRPTKAKFGQYIFYLDFEGSYNEKRVQSTLQKVEKSVAFMKVLGSY